MDRVLCRIGNISMRKNDVIPAYKIWITLGINDVNNDKERSKNIYSCLQTENYIQRPFNEAL